MQFSSVIRRAKIIYIFKVSKFSKLTIQWIFIRELVHFVWSFLQVISLSSLVDNNNGRQMSLPDEIFDCLYEQYFTIHKAVEDVKKENQGPPSPQLVSPIISYSQLTLFTSFISFLDLIKLFPFLLLKPIACDDSKKTIETCCGSRWGWWILKIKNKNWDTYHYLQ